jgi:hypothetical protein
MFSGSIAVISFKIKQFSSQRVVVNTKSNIGDFVLHIDDSSFHRQGLNIVIFLIIIDKVPITALLSETIRQFIEPVDKVQYRFNNT